MRFDDFMGGMGVSRKPDTATLEPELLDANRDPGDETNAEESE